MDPLSDVLSLLKPRSYSSGGFDMGGAWSLQFPRHGGIKCYAVVSGACWLAVDGLPEPTRLVAGDAFLLTSGRPFRLASNLALAPVDAMALIAAARATAPPGKSIFTCNGGGDAFIAGGHFLLAGPYAEMLTGVLPPIAHLRDEGDRAAMRWSLERMRRELVEAQPGAVLIAQHLAHMMLVQALRLHLAAGPRGGVGWLFALADREMSAAIGALHDDPARRWNLADPAQHAGMSRSNLALRFKETVGVSPMDYLTRWRMLLAADRLAGSREPVGAIARQLGYESESAFSTAFKRVMGCAPRRYGRAEAAPADAPALALGSIAPGPTLPAPIRRVRELVTS